MLCSLNSRADAVARQLHWPRITSPVLWIANRLVAGVEVLAEAADFRPGDRVRTLKGSLLGVVKKILPDGRVAWLPDGNETELMALPESLLKEKKGAKR